MIGEQMRSVCAEMKLQWMGTSTKYSNLHLIFLTVTGFGLPRRKVFIPSTRKLGSIFSKHEPERSAVCSISTTNPVALDGFSSSLFYIISSAF